MWFVRWFVVPLSVVILTTVGLNAFDSIGSPNRSLLGAAFSALSLEPCSSDMALVQTSAGDFCIDRYESATGDTCPVKDPQNKVESDVNLLLQSCAPESVKGRLPWRYVTRQQAELACARAGKRLPTNNEWYRAALGTPDKNGGWGKEDCNVDTVRNEEPEKTGSRPLCVSPAGVFDMIGNVWEWLEETVEDGEYVNASLPDDGYVADIDGRGVPRATSPEVTDESFFEDYFWVADTNVRGMLRGGYWRSQTDAGQYALNVTVPPSFVGTAVGFRCVQAVR